MQLADNNNLTSQFLTALFNRLNEEKVTYCVLRNYEDLPESVGNDLDIWVEKKSWVRFFNIVKETAYTLNYTLNYTPRLTIKGEGDFFLIKELENNLTIIHLDCWAYLHWKGICFVDESVIGKYLKWNDKGFYIPNPGVEASINLLKDLIYHGKVKDKYKEIIKTYSNKEQQIFIESIKKPFGKKTAKFLLEMGKSGKWNILEKSTYKLRLILFLRSLIYLPSQIVKWVYYLKAQLRRFFINPYGLFIVFIGPDGSGKTTTAQMILNSDVTKLFQKKNYFHGHFPFLPELKKIVKFLKRNKKIKEGTNSNKQFGILRSMIYPIYYGFNYFLGHLFIWKEKARAGLIIFDRYFFDYYIQKQFINCPRWLLRLIEKLIPKPDIIIYLKNTPEVIWNRKKELSMEEIKRQMLVCEEITKRYDKRSFIIETNSIEGTILSVQKIIVNKRKNSKQ
jgi:thymidylate kinase